MSGGFLSRFRFKRDPAASDANSSPAHEASHSLQQDSGPAQDGGSTGGMPEQVASSDLPAEGNDIAMEKLTLSHEGIDLEQEGSSLKLAQYAINGNSPAPPDDGETLSSTLEPIAESKEMTGMPSLSSDIKDELGEAGDDDPDLDDLT